MASLLPLLCRDHPDGTGEYTDTHRLPRLQQNGTEVRNSLSALVSETDSQQDVLGDILNPNLNQQGIFIQNLLLNCIN